MNAETNNQAAAAVNPIQMAAHDEFGALENVIVNSAMINSAVDQLKNIETSLQSNVDIFIAENGGEESVKEQLANGELESLTKANFKIAIVRETIDRFEATLVKGKESVDSFVKI